MNTFRYAVAAGALSLALGSSPAMADPSKDAAMLKLAASSGCTV